MLSLADGPVSDRDAPHDLLRSVFSRRPSALFCDLDGTLSPLVDVPQRARILAGCRTALRVLGDRIDLVCILTGRPADEAWRMVGIDDVLYVGDHGAETWRRGELLRPAGIERYEGRLARARSILRDLLAGTPGLIFEDKGTGFAVHYRRYPSAAVDVVAAAVRVARRRGLQVAIRTDHVEVRAPIDGDKGSALGELAERHALRGLVVIGDDPVDEPAFAAARKYAWRTGASLAAVAVGHCKVPGDVRVAGPAAVGELLLKVARSMRP